MKTIYCIYVNMAEPFTPEDLPMPEMAPDLKEQQTEHNKKLQEKVFAVIDKMFDSNPELLVQHQLDSYNDFMLHDVAAIFEQNNPLRIFYDNKKVEVNVYFGNGSEKNTTTGDLTRVPGAIRFGLPVINDRNDDNSPYLHTLFPNEARLRNLTYSLPIMYDVVVELQLVDSPRQVYPFQNVLLGYFPIMVNSKLCVLHGLDRELKFNLGECRNDRGGYFIIDGKEKVMVSQERMGTNQLRIAHSSKDGVGLYASILSASEDASKHLRTTSVKFLTNARPDASVTKRTFEQEQIVVDIPSVQKSIPLFIVMRALGIEADQDIIQLILLDTQRYGDLSELLRPSVHDAGKNFTQYQCLCYIGFHVKNAHVAQSYKPTVRETDEATSTVMATKYTNINHPILVTEILTNYFLAHVGENLVDKAYYLAHIVRELLLVKIGAKPVTDRDSFLYKRVDLPGRLLRDLFNDYFKLQKMAMRRHIDHAVKQYEKQKKQVGEDAMNYRDTFDLLMQSRSAKHEFFESERIVEEGILRGFKGDWGAQTYTKRDGIVQKLNRLSFNSYLSNLRKTVINLKIPTKNKDPMVLHTSQWGLMDFFDSPDSADNGLHKYMSIGAMVSTEVSPQPLIELLKSNWLGTSKAMLPLSTFTQLLNPTLMFQVMINGNWVGFYATYEATVKVMDKLRTLRRFGLIPLTVSIRLDFMYQVLYIATDSGRICRPVFYTYCQHAICAQGGCDNYATVYELGGTEPNYCDQHKPSNTVPIRPVYKLSSTKFSADQDMSWSQLVAGTFNVAGVERDLSSFDWRHGTIMYDWVKKNKQASVTTLMATGKLNIEAVLAGLNLDQAAVIEFIDTAEEESALIADTEDKVNMQVKPAPHYTHIEIHPSLLFGIMSNQIILPHTNQAPRNVFACSQTRQAVSLYHSNYQNRFDGTGIVLNMGQKPLVKSHYQKHIDHEEMPYGVNCIVAIMTWTGYNQEDSILINEGAIKRGMFRTTYLSSYEVEEESSKRKNQNMMSSQTEAVVQNVQLNPLLTRKPNFDYSHLDELGLIKVNTAIDKDKVVLIGKASHNINDPDHPVDESVTNKKGIRGFVDRTYLSQGEPGFRVARVRVREDRMPVIGDKFCSRCGQKGTVGLIVPEQDMPFTEDGLRPDLIINPHAFPSRMTVGHLIETIVGKACSFTGSFGDSTAFNSNGIEATELFGQLLQEHQFSSRGEQVMYDGLSGQQIEVNVFIGPCFYMRLKHMTQDKLNYRSTGPKALLTRQPLEGRAKDGGLRIGEMERDGLVSHGMSRFLQESMMERADKYQLYICNQTGMIAVYNPEQDLYLSPVADGPLPVRTQLTELSDDVLYGNQSVNETVTRFGRTFSLVQVPYAFKLLMQELATCNVQLRLLTDDNIDQVQALQRRAPDVPISSIAATATATATTRSRRATLAKPAAKEDVSSLMGGVQLDKAKVTYMVEATKLQEAFVDKLVRNADPKVSNAMNLAQNLWADWVISSYEATRDKYRVLQSLSDSSHVPQGMQELLHMPETVATQIVHEIWKQREQPQKTTPTARDIRVFVEYENGGLHLRDTWMLLDLVLSETMVKKLQLTLPLDTVPAQQLWLVLALYTLLYPRTCCYQAALPPAVLDVLQSAPLQVEGELFASPFNHYLYEYYSMFPYDRAYGSRGSFLEAQENEFERGSYVANPPYVASILDMTSDRILRYLRDADHARRNLTFVLLFPAAYAKLDALNNKFLVLRMRLPAEQHYYVEYLLEEDTPRSTPATVDSELFILSTDPTLQMALQKLNIQDALRRAFQPTQLAPALLLQGSVPEKEMEQPQPILTLNAAAQLAAQEQPAAMSTAISTTTATNPSMATVPQLILKPDIAHAPSGESVFAVPEEKEEKKDEASTDAPTKTITANVS